MFKEISFNAMKKCLTKVVKFRLETYFVLLAVVTLGAFLGLSSAFSAGAEFKHSPFALSSGFADCNIKFNATGYFRIGSKNGVYWFITPDGCAFYSTGVTGIKFRNYMKKDQAYFSTIKKRYGSSERYGNAVIKRLKDWGFNTLGAWCEESLFTKQRYPFVKELSITPFYNRLRNASPNRFPDVFSKQFRQKAEERVKKQAKKYRFDPYLVGYFTDNEVRFFSFKKAAFGQRKLQHLLDLFVNEWTDTAGHKAAAAFLESRYRDDFNKFTEVWQTSVGSFKELATKRQKNIAPRNSTQASLDREAFLRLAAHNYYKTVTELVRQYDPNHLLLGSRFIRQRNVAPTLIAPVVQEALRYNDALSLNLYTESPLEDDHLNILINQCKLYKKPLMITEFSFRIAQGQRGSRGAHVPAARTDAARGLLYQRYVEELLSSPYIVGFHYFRWVDRESEDFVSRKHGNFEGRLGLVNTRDEPWEDFLQSVRETNQSIYGIRRKISRVP